MHNLDHERVLWDSYAESVTRTDVEPLFRWTQYDATHGSGVEVLGSPATALELGCGTGRALAALANTGVKATGLDLSPAMVAWLEQTWGDRVCVFEGDALSFLDGHGELYGAVYSIFGAAWFTDPRELFPRVHQVLEPGGVFAFSQPPAIPGAYGPQGMYKGGFTGPAMFTYRYSYTPARWRSLMRAAGFTDITAEVLEAPEPDHIGTLMVRGVRSAEEDDGGI